MSDIDVLISKEYDELGIDGKVYSLLSKPIIFFDITPPKVKSVNFIYNKYDKYEKLEKKNYINEFKWDSETNSYTDVGGNSPPMEVVISVTQSPSNFVKEITPSVVQDNIGDQDEPHKYKKVFENLQDVTHIETNDYFQFDYSIKRGGFDKYSYIGEIKNSNIYSYAYSKNNVFAGTNENTLNLDFIFENNSTNNIDHGTYAISISRQLRYIALKNLYSLSFAGNSQKKKISEFVVGGMIRFTKDNTLAKDAYYVELDTDWYLSLEDYAFSNYMMEKVSKEVLTLASIDFFGQPATSGGDIFNLIKSYTGTKINKVGYAIRRGLANENMSIVAAIIGDLADSNIVFPTTMLDRDIVYGEDYVYSISSLVEVEQSYFGDEENASLNIGKTYIAGSQSILLYVSTKDYIPSHPPKDFNIVFNGSRAILNWSFPSDAERKIKKFNIYKRSNIEQPFKLIMQYDFRDWKGGYGETTEGFKTYGQTDNIRVPSVFIQSQHPNLSYIDTNFSFGDIYAVTSVDAHENESNYSQQLMVVSAAGVFSIKPTTKMISILGAPLPYPNWFLYKELTNNISDFVSLEKIKEFKLYLDPDAKKITGMKFGLNDNLESDQNKFVLNVVNTDLMEERNIDIKISSKKQIK